MIRKKNIKTRSEPCHIVERYVEMEEYSKMLNLKEQLMYKNKIRLYKGFFAVLLITITITIFELIFYIYIVKPNIKNGIDALKSNYDKVQLIELIKERETKLIMKSVLNSYIVIILLIIFMSMSIFAIYLKILNIHQKLDITHTKLKFNDVVFYSFVTISIIICFQIIFYNFGINYKYIEKDEILYRILSNI